MAASATWGSSWNILSWCWNALQWRWKFWQVELVGANRPHWRTQRRSVFHPCFINVRIWSLSDLQDFCELLAGGLLELFAFLHHFINLLNLFLHVDKFALDVLGGFLLVKLFAFKLFFFCNKEQLVEVAIGGGPGHQVTFFNLIANLENIILHLVLHDSNKDLTNNSDK